MGEYVNRPTNSSGSASACDAAFAAYPSLRGRAVFVTGGATGIGAETVAHFAHQGARVCFVDIDDDAARELAERIERDGGVRPRHWNCDVRDIEALRRAIAAAAEAAGPIRVLVNNAANDQRHPYADVTVESWDERMAVNLRHHFFAIQAVAPMMRAAGGGSVINMGSISWHVALGEMPGYTTAKGGIEGLTRGMARDLGGDGIRVNCLIPGWVVTERQRRLWLTDAVRDELMRVQCLKELVLPADVARMLLWLAADDSRMCTAQTWVVDGGWM